MPFQQILVFFALVASVAHAADRPLVIHDVAVVHTEAGLITPPTTVLVAGEHIEEVGPDIEVQEGARIVDGSGLYAVPGLWDMHVHAFWTESDPERMFPLFVANGVTGIRDMGSPLDLDQLQRLRARYEGEPSSPRLVMVGKLVGGDPPVWSGSLTVGGAAEARAAVQLLRAARFDAVKVYARLSGDAYIEIAKAAKRASLQVVGHLPMAVSALEAARAGHHSIEHLSELLLACSSREKRLREELLKAAPGSPRDAVRRAQLKRLVETFDRRKASALSKAFRRSGTWQVPTLLIQRTYAYPPSGGFSAAAWARYISEEKLDSYTKRLTRFRDGKTREELDWQSRTYEREVELVRIMNRAKGGFLVGTDADTFYPAGFGVHREMELLAEAGLGAAGALRAATLNAARALGKADAFGTIQPGRLADLVLLEANPLADIRNIRGIRAVILRGRLYPREELDRMLALAQRH